MTQATRVYSTPPTNTSAIDHPKMFPPRDSSRRGFLALAAGGAVAGLIPTAVLAAAPSVDPVFELIEAHRKAHAAHMAALQLQNRFERRYGIGGASWVSTKACHDEDDAFEAFVTEPAATVQGLVAKLAYFDELAGEFETEWMVYDRAEAGVLIQSFAASLKNIGVLS
jgi:hypothetical protein